MKIFILFSYYISLLPICIHHTLSLDAYLSISLLNSDHDNLPSLPYVVVIIKTLNCLKWGLVG